MKKQNVAEIVLYLTIGLIILIGYCLLMITYFKINPFKGYYIIVTLYMLICFILFPIMGQKVRKVIDDNRLLEIICIPIVDLSLAYVLAPFILLICYIGKK